MHQQPLQPSGLHQAAPAMDAALHRQVLAAKYGALAGSRRPTMPRKFFDSGEWALVQQGRAVPEAASASTVPPDVLAQLPKAYHHTPRRGSYNGSSSLVAGGQCSPISCRALDARVHELRRREGTAPA